MERRKEAIAGKGLRSAPVHDVAGDAPEAGQGAAFAASVLSISGLQVGRGGRAVLDDINLELRRGERVGLVGDNGIGKSTLLQCVLGSLPVVNGEIAVAGARCGSREAGRAIGYVPQHPGTSLLPWFTVARNITLPLQAQGVAAKDRIRALNAIRDRLDPEHRIDLDALPLSLSGGQQQLVCLMRGVIGSPALVLCDEPLSSIDTGNRDRLRTSLRDVFETHPDLAVLLVSHDEGDLAGLVERVVMLRGRPARLRAQAMPHRQDAAPPEAETPAPSATGHWSRWPTEDHRGSDRRAVDRRPAHRRESDRPEKDPPETAEAQRTSDGHGGEDRQPADNLRTDGWRRKSRRLWPFVSFGCALALWALLTESGLIVHRAIAGPIATFTSWWAAATAGSLLEDVAATGYRLFAGVGLGLAVGLPLGLFVGASRLRRAVLEPGLDFLRAIPPLLVFPLFLLALGYNDRARIGAVAFATTLVMAMYIANAASRVSVDRRQILAVMGASRRQFLRWLYLYELLPGLMTGVRHAISTGIVVAVVTEMVVGAERGLGSRAVSAQIAYDAPTLYAVILTTGCFGYVVSMILLTLERHAIFWERGRLD